MAETDAQNAENHARERPTPSECPAAGVDLSNARASAETSDALPTPVPVESRGESAEVDERYVQKLLGTRFSRDARRCQRRRDRFRAH